MLLSQHNILLTQYVTIVIYYENTDFKNIVSNINISITRLRVCMS